MVGGKGVGKSGESGEDVEGVAVDEGDFVEDAVDGCVGAGTGENVDV